MLRYRGKIIKYFLGNLSFGEELQKAAICTIYSCTQNCKPFQNTRLLYDCIYGCYMNHPSVFDLYFKMKVLISRTGFSEAVSRLFTV